MSLTQQQSDAIASRGKVIVSASAGSGKTHVMIERLAEILRGGEADVKEILAVTFTKKAAAQMRERARKKLAEAYRAAAGEERARLKRQLDDLPLADISTIHSFCGRIVRTYFYLVGVDPRFVIISGDGQEGRALSTRALNLAFDSAYESGEAWFDELLAVYFRKKNDGTLRSTVRTLYEKIRVSDHYRERLQTIASRTPPAWDIADMGDPVSFIKQNSDPAKEELLRAYRVIGDNLRALAAESAKKFSRLKVLAEQYAPRLLDFIDTVIEAMHLVAAAEDLFAMYALKDRILIPKCPRRDNKKDSPETLRLFSLVQDLVKRPRDMCNKTLANAPDFPTEFMRFADGYTRGASLARLALMYDEEFMRLKREAGVLDYNDLEHLALEVLQSEEAVRSVRERYRYIFVDEYQDVNPMQSEILKALTGEQLFVVGDKKQAIYGFRGSRTVFFSRMEDACGGALHLDRNFRSATAVLEAVNTVFSGAMEGYTPMEGGDRYLDRKGEVLVHTAEEAAGTEDAVRGVYSVAAAEGNVRENPVANKILDIIEEECGRRGSPAKQWFDVETGTERTVGYGDIAVLVRYNVGTASDVCRVLSARGIPVTSAAGVNICDFFEVRLLLDWLSLLDNGEQDIPFASAMLSAIGGFTERELARIRLTANAMYPSKSDFRTAVKRFAAEKGPSGDPLAAKVNKFLQKVSALRTLAYTKTASEMLSILLADGIEAQIAGMGGGKTALARVRRLIAESAEAGDIHTFLRRIEDVEDKIVFSERGGEGAVRVLTMHDSKGLEFPVVIVADLDESFHKIESDELMWTEELGVAPRSFDTERKLYFDTPTRAAAAICMRRQQIEGEKNLLYVAMTRAMYRLHLVFEEACSAEEEGEELHYSPDRATKMSEFIPREKMIGYLAPPIAAAASAPEAAAEQAETSRAEEIRAAVSPYPFEASTLLPVKSSATGLIRDVQQEEEKRGYHVCEEDAKDALMTDMDAAFSTDTGLAYHAFLEHVRFGADAGEELARMRREHALTDAQLALLDERHLAAILHIPLLAGLVGKTLWRERQFLVSLPAAQFYGEDADGEVIFQGAIDLLVKEARGYLVVDYKFSSRDRAGIQAHYAPQIALYRRAVAKILHLPLEEVRAVIINIASGEEIPM